MYMEWCVFKTHRDVYLFHLVACPETIMLHWMKGSKG
uniref:Uncharacterized protein n=1 Tax=Manihot esculenta TaxID=3983 RepID=A0A2C9U3Y4_MANES